MNICALSYPSYHNVTMGLEDTQGLQCTAEDNTNDRMKQNHLTA